MLIDFLKALLLGIIEGLTEFLPVSSTGHLILANQWLTFSPKFNFLFDVFVQLGAILAVIIYFFPRLWPLNKTSSEKKSLKNLWQKILLSVSPALFLGFFLNNWIEEKLFNPLTVASALLAGGIILIWAEHRPRPSKFLQIKDLPLKTAFFIGIFQCLAMIPGTSRSAATIISAMLLGASRQVATEFSFFLAIPTMLAASSFSLLKYNLALSANEILWLASGFATAFFTAWLTIKYFLLYIQKNTLLLFGYYRIILGLLLLFIFYF